MGLDKLTAMPPYIKAAAPIIPYPLFVVSGLDGSLTSSIALVIRKGCAKVKAVRHSRGNTADSKCHLKNRNEAQKRAFLPSGVTNST